MKRERQDLILKILKEHGVIKVVDLVPRFSNSVMTLRRDLDELEERGLVTRVHGGAVLSKENNDNLYQPSFQRRMDEHLKEKRLIGQKAAQLVQPGDIIILDAGSTPYVMMDYLKSEMPFALITPGLLTATRALEFKQANIINIGGEIHKSSYSSVGINAIKNIEQYHAHKAFISTKAFNLPLGCYEADMQLIEIKRSIVRSAEQVILLADHTKFNSISLSPSVAVSEIDTIITNENANPEVINELERRNINIVFA
ncbi:MAG: DeoR/GlpR transcriptional regulator [Abditibacteriota bacterium]|nr:DeoR/GlpR transcriptional regulator [Abditibacteriota bacterium]